MPVFTTTFVPAGAPAALKLQKDVAPTIVAVVRPDRDEFSSRMNGDVGLCLVSWPAVRVDSEAGAKRFAVRSESFAVNVEA